MFLPIPTVTLLFFWKEKIYFEHFGVIDLSEICYRLKLLFYVYEEVQNHERNKKCHYISPIFSDTSTIPGFSDMVSLSINTLLTLPRCSALLITNVPRMKYLMFLLLFSDCFPKIRDSFTDGDQSSRYLFNVILFTKAAFAVPPYVFRSTA